MKRIILLLISSTLLFIFQNCGNAGGHGGLLKPNLGDLIPSDNLPDGMGIDPGSGADGAGDDSSGSDDSADSGADGSGSDDSSDGGGSDDGTSDDGSGSDGTADDGSGSDDGSDGSSDGGADDGGSTEEPLYACIVSPEPQNNVILYYVDADNPDLQEQSSRAGVACMTQTACEDIAKSYFENARSDTSNPICDRNPTVVSLSDEDVESIIDSK